MEAYRFGAVAARSGRGLVVFLRVGMWLGMLGLAGCADTHWERSVYQGARYGNAQCELKRRPADAPCAELVDYDRYQQERAKARNASPPSTQDDKIEETQR